MVQLLQCMQHPQCHLLMEHPSSLPYYAPSPETSNYIASSVTEHYGTTSSTNSFMLCFIKSNISVLEDKQTKYGNVYYQCKIHCRCPNFDSNQLDVSNVLNS